MTVLDLSTLTIGAKSNSLLSLALKKTIVKKDWKKPTFRNQDLLKSSLGLVNIKKIETKQAKIPIKPAYHKIDWNWSSNSESVLFSADSKAVCFHSDCQSCFETDAVRGDTPLKLNAFTYWEVSILNEHLNGTSIQIGIGNKSARHNSMGYLNLLGIDKNSYGLTQNGQVWHGNGSKQFCSAWGANDRIGCLFNGFNGQLSYYRNGIFLGVAFKDVDMSESLYPMISSTVAQSAFRLDGVYESFPSLKDLCRKSILKEKMDLAGQMLPKHLLSYLK